MTAMSGGFIQISHFFVIPMNAYIPENGSHWLAWIIRFAHPSARPMGVQSACALVQPAPG